MMTTVIRYMVTPLHRDTGLWLEGFNDFTSHTP
jgi:hypothetical protein